MENKLRFALPEKAKDIVDELMSEEFYAISFYTYLSFCFTSKGYFKAAEWAMKESDSERSHFLSLSEFLQARGIEPDVPAAKQPEIDFTDLQSGIKAAYMLEIALTEKYNELIPLMFKTDVMGYLKLCDFIKIQESALREMSDLWSMFENADSEQYQRLLEMQRWGEQNESPVAG